MARLYLIPGSQSYGPVPGGEVSNTFGSNQAEKLSLAANAHVVFDPSFVRGNDWIVILGNAADYDISANVAGITITSDSGANIRIPAFDNSGGLKIEFNDVELRLVTDSNGATFLLEGDGGSQVIDGTPTPIDPSVGSNSTPFSLEIGSATVPVNLDAATDNFRYSDNAEATTNVRITGFSLGDHIAVTNAVASDYNFQRDFSDLNDLVITYTDQDSGATNKILLDDILPDNGAASSLASATATIGFAFMTFA